MHSSEISTFIEKFEAGTLRQDEWHHREHLMMALWYLTKYDQLTAIMKIKAGILRYNVLYQAPQNTGRGYHETITLFFVKLVQHFLSHDTKFNSWDEKVARLTELYPNHMETLKQHYKKETLSLDHSRIVWVEPDLQTIGADFQ